MCPDLLCSQHERITAVWINRDAAIVPLRDQVIRCSARANPDARVRPYLSTVAYQERLNNAVLFAEQ